MHEHEHTRKGIATLSAGVFGLAACGAFAADHELEFKLVVMPVEVKNFEVANVDGQNVQLSRMTGVAYFKDGRVASKNFVYNSDLNKGSGPYYGYSTYQFEDGATLTARFSGTLRAGQPAHGEYTILSGTGAYAGAQGRGSFDAVPHKLAGANVFNGKFSFTTP